MKLSPEIISQNATICYFRLIQVICTCISNIKAFETTLKGKNKRPKQTVIMSVACIHRFLHSILNLNPTTTILPALRQTNHDNLGEKYVLHICVTCSLCLAHCGLQMTLTKLIKTIKSLSPHVTAVGNFND